MAIVFRSVNNSAEWRAKHARYMRSVELMREAPQFDADPPTVRLEQRSEMDSERAKWAVILRGAVKGSVRGGRRNG